MMKVYQEITLLPGAEISAGFLWQKLYQPLHMLMVETQDKSAEHWISVSFPQYTQKFLGHKLRVFAQTEEALQNFGYPHFVIEINYENSI
jgi:CRISPR-associated protein (Cas_Csy4).